MQQWQQSCKPLKRAVQAFQKRSNYTSQPFGAPPIDFWVIRERNDISSPQYRLFEDRFRRAMVNNGFTNQKLATALTKALHEMADNIIQHSARQGYKLHGIVAYQVSDRAMTFATADVGCGIRQSLQENPKWQQLSTGNGVLSCGQPRCKYESVYICIQERYPCATRWS